MNFVVIAEARGGQRRRVHGPFQDNARLRKMLAAYNSSMDARPASAVTPNGSDRLSWLRTRLRAAGLKTRDSAWRILIDVEELDPSAFADVVEALHEMVDETDRWQNAWSASTVNHDHKLRDAMRRSESCEHHGEEIKALTEQLHHFDQAHQQAEAGRLALVGLLHEIRKFVDGYRTADSAGRPVPTGDEIVTALDRLEKQASAAHDRAWKPKPTKKAAKTATTPKEGA